MNLLVNAAHAIEKQGGRSRPLDVGSRVPARFKCKGYEDMTLVAGKGKKDDTTVTKEDISG